MTSAKTARRLNRILAMLPWVIAHPGVSVEELCDRFDYTKSELVNDLNTVFVCGLPGYGPGDLMVAYIDEDEVVVEMADYFARPLRLAPHEMLVLIASGRALLSSGQGSDVLRRAVDKLEAVLLPDGEESLVVDLAEPPLVGVLGAAAAEGQVVRIEHVPIASGVPKTRDVEPWAVFSTMGNWYVSAYCRLVQDERVFRLDRIRTADVTGDTFDPPSDPPEPLVRYTPSESDVRATLRLGSSARWVADYYPVDVIAVDDTGLTVRFSASDAAIIARLLVRLGDTAELIDGDAVAASEAALRKRILARYS